MMAVSRQLVDHALPIYFPQKTTTNSMPQQKTQQTQKSQQSQKPQQPSSSRQHMNGETTIEPVITKCCIDTCPTKFDNSEPKIHGFKYVKILIRN